MPRPKNAWQPALTQDERELAQRIAEACRPRPTIRAVLQDALKEYAESKGVEA